MRFPLILAAAALVMPTATLAVSAHTAKVPAYVTAAIADPARAADRENDARRKIAAVMTFAEVKPGQNVLELVPGSGYWTRVFSGIVGSKGHVYTVWPAQMEKYATKSLAKWQALVKTPHYANVMLLQQQAAALSAPAPVDLVFTCQNYHDYLDPFMGPVDMVKFNREVFAALKPGGLFVIIDHVAPAGSGAGDTNTLHRIDPALVKQQVEAAGFVFDGASDALRNPADPHTVSVFDKSIRGKTDQFIYRFRKPKH
ncbi:MAG TPA: class I SAM-dependent methyltransferase [Gammaproteobacteria bacterium]|nr:class I SAM-dependent methyltransferase [Gammaproteobacteria bacterium]